MNRGVPCYVPIDGYEPDEDAGYANATEEMGRKAETDTELQLIYKES